jgi:hypothetical protein
MGRKVTQYKVICEPIYNIGDFNRTVNALIAEGWQPLRNANLHSLHTGNTYLCQTMVKYEEMKNE